MSKALNYDPQRLIELVRTHALQTGHFRLASGNSSSYYLDCRKLTLTGEGAAVVAAGMIERLKDDPPQAVGGLAIGADPLTAAIVVVSWQMGMQIAGFIVRKQAKGHGTGQWVEGPVLPGYRAVVVEDVITTGGSALEAVQRARQFGLNVDRVLAIVDRSQGAAEGLLAQHQLKLETLLTVQQLGIG